MTFLLISEEVRGNKVHRKLSGILLGVCGLTIFTGSNTFAARPDAPAINRDVHMARQPSVNERPRYTRPTMPTLQTSYDGRIALSHKLEENEDDRGPDQVSFRLQKPEKFTTLFKDSPNGTFILDRANAAATSNARLGGGNNSVPDLNVLTGSVGGTADSHLGLCDVTFDEHSAIKNPQACGIGNTDDCYDLWVVRFERLPSNNGRILHGTRVNVRVINPKTVDASIAEVTITERKKTSNPHRITDSFEPMFPGDGRLLVGRSGNSTIVAPYEGEPAMRSDAIYIVNDNPDDFEACDINQWEGPGINPDTAATPRVIPSYLRPLSYAPYDETINTRYGFAMQPFRDGQNNVIPKNIPLGSYPWIDRGGDVISLTTIGRTLYDSTGTLTLPYGPSGLDLDPNSSPLCPAHTSINCNSNTSSQNIGQFGGRTLMGLWTRGKMVLLDDIINNIDFNLNADDASHREVRLYDTGPTYKRIGNGPDNIASRLPLGNGGNNRFLDSNEHRFNYFPNLSPVTPADVVWLMSTGRGTAEINFDDYLNPNSFINSNMAQLIRIRVSNTDRARENGQNLIGRNAIGNSATGGRFDILADDTTILADGTWNIPTQGNLIGDTRVEPIANGGIRGKGLWLDGDGAGIEYDIPQQSLSFENVNWYYGLFVDARGPTNTERALIHFPDNSEIRLGNNNSIHFYDITGTLVETYVSNEPLNFHRWRHYGFNISYDVVSDSTTVLVYLNGYLVTTVEASSSAFQLQENETLTIGESPNSNDLRGWIDDVKVFAEPLTPELACNMANGTLAGISDASVAPNHWSNFWATSVELTAHEDITNILNSNYKQTYSQYVCYHDYSEDGAAHLANIPNGLTGVRADLVFPEGPLLQDQPRPDSVNNAFCLSCHTADAPANSGLTIGALALQPHLLAPSDPRRQPMQPDARVYGNIPANWIAPGIPESAISDVTGILIDRLILASSHSIETPEPETPEPETPEPETPEPETPEPETPEPETPEPETPEPETPEPETPEPETPEPETPAPDASNVVNLTSAAETTITYSMNWHTNRDRAHDGNLQNIATTTSDGTSAGGGGVFIAFDFGAPFTNFIVTMKEDNNNFHQVDFWRVQRWANGAWINLPDRGENSNDSTLKTFPIPSGIASTRLRVQLQAPSGQQVGVQDIGITAQRWEPETPEPETPEPETPEPETPEPETPEPETPAPETPEPETPAPETPAPETPEPET
ncbi:hypothetical protein EU509_00380, partial [Pseudoalteromonas fuliginea]